MQIAEGPAILAPHMGVSNVFGGRFLAIPAWSVTHIAQQGHPSDLQVLAGLVETMNVRTKLVNVSIVKLAETTNLSKETVKRSVKWLTDHHVISVMTRSKSSGNTYRINYEQKIVGSWVTHRRVMDDPSVGSWVTHHEDTGRVMGDPSKMPETEEFPRESDEMQTPRIIELLDNEKEKLKRVVTDDGKVVDMILGSDPEEVKPEPSVGRKRADGRKTRPEVNDLAGYFVYHPKSVMTCSYTHQDMNILRRSIRLLLDGGLTRTSIRQMIDKFFSNEKFASAESPVLTFSSKSIQQGLMSATGIQLDTDTDPILMFMINDFTRGDLELPWISTADKVLREVIIMHGMEICYRYPELIAEIIRHYADDFGNPELRDSLDALNSLVRWHTGEEDGDPENLRYSIPSINLPKELQSNNKSTLRPASDTIASAIYTYRRMTRSQ